MKYVWLALVALVVGAGSASAQGLSDLTNDSHYDSYWSVYPTGTFWTQIWTTGIAQSGDASGITLHGLAEALWTNSISTSNGFAFQIEFVQESASGNYVIDKWRACQGKNVWPSFWTAGNPGTVFYPGATSTGFYSTAELGMHFQRSTNSTVPSWQYVRYISLGWSDWEQYAIWASGAKGYWPDPNGNGFYWLDNGSPRTDIHPFSDGAVGSTYSQGALVGGNPTTNGANWAYVPPYADDFQLTYDVTAPGSYSVTRFVFLAWWTDRNGNLMLPSTTIELGDNPTLHIARYGVMFSGGAGVRPGG